jgi:antitoxin MazE
MKAKLVRIGNSKGIRLPSSVIKECSLEYEVDLQVKDGAIIIRSAAAPRTGWSEAFGRAEEKSAKPTAQEFSDIEDAKNDWDESEWEWK